MSGIASFLLPVENCYYHTQMFFFNPFFPPETYPSLEQGGLFGNCCYARFRNKYNSSRAELIKGGFNIVKICTIIGCHGRIGYQSYRD
ncbi:MAG: hypothetical protein B6245_19180 [Desulfobacteraceae bacterium 4572_88]|nr:MAG: hypothetical protein B6245_19180 [Desulfobacteraceae bacterium 4572_88]